MTDLTQETLAELKRLDAAATQGPWKSQFDDFEEACEVVPSAEHPHAPVVNWDAIVKTPWADEEGSEEYFDHSANAALIAAMRNALPALIAAAEREAWMREALKKLMLDYVSLLEDGHDRIKFLSGNCDPVDVMEENSPALRRARAALAGDA